MASQNKGSVLPVPKREPKKFPPPLTFLDRTRRTKRVIKEHVTEDGWSVLKEEEVSYYGYHFKANRSNGRLQLNLVICPDDDGDHEDCPRGVIVEENNNELNEGADDAGSPGKAEASGKAVAKV